MMSRVVRRAVLALVVIACAGCIVDEQEPGPNVYTFNYDQFAGRGNVATSTDTDEWDLSPASGVLGTFDLTVGLAPGARVFVYGSGIITSAICPSSATANCTVGPAQNAQ